MQQRLRSLLASIPVVAVLALAPSASATCNAINATVQNGKAWYGAADAPPTLIFNIADDQGTYHDTLNEVTGSYFATTFTGPFAWVAAPPWSSYARGWNNLRVALYCSAGTLTQYVSVAYDPDAPSAAWSAPAPNQWVRGTVSLQAVGSDALSGIDHYEFALPSGVATSAGGAATLDTTMLADGPRLLSVSSVDHAGNRSADTPTRTIRIDNSAPLVTLTAPLAGAAFSGALSLAATASDAGSGVAQTRFELRSAGGAWQPLGSAADAPYHADAAAPAADGPYDVRAVATDALGNETATPASAIVVDRTAPTVSLDALQPAVGGTIALGVDAGDAGSGLARVTYQFEAAGSATWQTIVASDATPF
ncbi:MAG TPA: Ig-like domain-containing protein, partial [Gaiellales bacterium]